MVIKSQRVQIERNFLHFWSAMFSQRKTCSHISSALQKESKTCNSYFLQYVETRKTRDKSSGFSYIYLCKRNYTFDLKS